MEEFNIFIRILGMMKEVVFNRSANNANAIHAITNAYNHTRNYLNNNEFDPQGNLELADLWSEASRTCRLIDEDLANQLYTKSRFWADPGLFENVDVIALNDVIDQLDRLRF